MRDRIWEAAASFAFRHQRALTIIGAIWFWVGIAVYAGMIDLPELLGPESRTWFFWSSVVYNAMWWGFIHPQIAKRLKAIEGSAAQRAEAEES